MKEVSRVLNAVGFPAEITATVTRIIEGKWDDIRI